MKLPTKVKVGIFDYAIIAWGSNSANAQRRFGEFSVMENCIRIDVAAHQFKIVDTLIHEINHAIFYVYKLEDADNEERICSTMASAWAAVYRDNPEIIKWLTKYSK